MATVVSGSSIERHDRLRVERVKHMASPAPAPLRKLLPSASAGIAREIERHGPYLTSLLGEQFVMGARKAD